MKTRCTNSKKLGLRTGIHYDPGPGSPVHHTPWTGPDPWTGISCTAVFINMLI